ncbi:hypothetical protein E2P81_ATG08754 [Venturia nashicola]|uniref:Uncharacterized protein n=1 Tax=Venturia nashicola TaxID=86259 RepID=A0A4Z1NJC5_9PEZI|nr:hypothetical protein E6O75_ATG08949 [Venturia nashicola]TLD23410.1 hypothetical protein E2P81_ATG08754 [Venturia nashicola]
MARKNRGKASKKTRLSNAVDDVEASASVPATTTKMVEESAEFGGAVQAQSSPVDGVESQALPESATAATITPPETFAMPDIPSAMSSPTTFYSTFGSPVSDSTTSGIFDYAMTGDELLSTDNIEEQLLDAIPRDGSGPETGNAASTSNVASGISKSAAPQPDVQEESAVSKSLPSITVTNTSDHAEDSEDSDMSTIVPDDFVAETDAAIGAQAKKKKKKKNKNKKKAPDADDDRFQFRLSDIPQVHYELQGHITGNKIRILPGPAPREMGQDPKQRRDEITCHTLDGELVVRKVLENQYVYLVEVRPDLRWCPEQRPKPSLRSGKFMRREPLKNEYQTISTINVHRGAYWRPGNTLRDAAPTKGLYIDAQLVESVTKVKPELDVQPPSLMGPARKLDEKTQVMQEVHSETVSTNLQSSEKVRGKQKADPVSPTSQLSERAQGKQKASLDLITGTLSLNPEACVFTPEPVKPAAMCDEHVNNANYGIRPTTGAFVRFLEDHPTVKFVNNAAEAYALPTHALLGGPVIRPVPVDFDTSAAVSFLQGKRITPAQCPKSNFTDEDNAPENLYPGQLDRYNTSHLFDLEVKDYDPKSFTADGKDFQVHNCPFGSFVTNTDGVLVAPSGDSPLFKNKLSPMISKVPLSFNKGESRSNGVPMETTVPNQQPPCHVLTRDINPYFQAHGARMEVMPRPDSNINEQFLTSLQKATVPYFLRQGLSADSKWMEPAIPTGFSERAKHCQGIGRAPPATEAPIQVAHPATGKTTEATLIKPGLRGGGDAMMPYNIMTTVDAMPSPNTTQEQLDNASRSYSWLQGILLDQDSSEQPPYVILSDGAIEPIFSDRNLQRIANNPKKSKKATKLCGGFLAPVGAGSKIWSATDRYTCACCGSLYHGLKHCPSKYLEGDKTSCMSCLEPGHLLAACPYPIQNIPERTIVESLRLYLGTLHCRISILTWEFEMKVIEEDKFVKLRTEMVRNPLMGEALHALANLPGCPNCDSSSHQLSINSLIEACAARCRERGDIPEKWLTPGNWMYDLRRCPLYITIYNKNLSGHELYAYNHMNSVALDSIYRDFLRAQDWHIKTPVPQNKTHLHSKNPRTLKNIKPKLPAYALARNVLAGDKEYPHDWVANSQELDFFTWD